MHKFYLGEVRRQVAVGVTAMGCFIVLVYIGSSGRHVWMTPAEGAVLTPLADGMVGGIFIAGAACAALVGWRRHAGSGWTVATGALLAAQSLLVTLLALQSSPPRELIAVAPLLAAAVAGFLVVAGALTGLRRVVHVVDDCFAVGLGLGLVAAGHVLLQFPMARPPSTAMQALIGVLIATHVAAAALVLRQRVLSPSKARLVVGTVLIVSTVLLVHVGSISGPVTDTAVSLLLAAVGAAWLSLAWVDLRQALEDDRRRINSFEHVFVSATREQREHLHELRSTLAGLVSGSELLDSPDMPAETRERLWGSVRRELARMERLLSGQDAPATDIDLDEALGLILDLQRLKGRHVEFHGIGNGDAVRARLDSLSEVVNILMDNAVKHGSTDRSLVEVVRRDDETVDITVTDFGRGIPREQRAQIFEWGRRGNSQSPGEGIGLHVAQRLMTEDGGTLQLADRPGAGSSFVISLPAVRRSTENVVTVGGGHVRTSC